LLTLTAVRNNLANKYQGQAHIIKSLVPDEVTTFDVFDLKFKQNGPKCEKSRKKILLRVATHFVQLKCV
jgi:hypothetical protein